MNINPSRITVIAPHPDDETLGCGGTILNHKDKGDEINCCWPIFKNKKMSLILHY